jgi:hypothetical protein
MNDHTTAPRGSRPLRCLSTVSPGALAFVIMAAYLTGIVLWMNPSQRQLAESFCVALLMPASDNGQRLLRRGGQAA